MTRSDQASAEERHAIRQEVQRQAPAAVVAESVHGPAGWQNSQGDTLSADALRGRPVAGFCGLGNPEAFRRTLTDLGLEVLAWRTFPDHHNYSREDIEDLRRWAREQLADAALVTTQKDLVKIRLDRMGERELWALRVRLEVTEGKKALDDKLRQVCP